MNELDKQRQEIHAARVSERIATEKRNAKLLYQRGSKVDRLRADEAVKAAKKNQEV